MKTREELLYRITTDEIKPWPAFRRKFTAVWFSGVALAFSAFASAACQDQFPRAAPYLNFYARVGFLAGILLIFVGIPWVCLRIHCPKCGRRLDRKQWTTDAKGVVFPCASCRIGWSTGMLPYVGGPD
jgi:hypothetical protein